MFDKLHFYERHGVQEYYQYDPDTNQLQGWVCQGELLRWIEETNGWQSPRLGIRFEVTDSDMVVYYPDGRKFETYVEIQQRADQESRRADQEKQRAEYEKRRADLLAQKLRELGMDPDSSG